MKNILNEKDQKEVVERINKISADSQRLWGKMNANEMLCHSSDQICLGWEKLNRYSLETHFKRPC
jgi:hypothetical protein